MSGAGDAQQIKLANEDAYDVFLQESKRVVGVALAGTTPQLRTNVNKFKAVAFLGKGAYGKVILVRHMDTKEEVAMKCVRKKDIRKHAELAVTEKRILASVRHPHVLNLRYFAKDQYYLFFFLPYITGGNLYQMLKRMQALNEDHARFYMSQVYLGLEYLHVLDILYRDLKPENIILEADGYIKISDFGLSKILHKERTCTICGTPEYIAPEIIKSKGYGKSCDWWSYGVFSYELVAGVTPFRGAKTVIEIYNRISDGDYSIPSKFSSKFKDLIKSLLQVNVSFRIGCLRLGPREIKKHAFFQDINWIRMFNKEISAPFIPPVFTSDKPLTKSVLEILDTSEESEYDAVFDEF